MMMELIGSAKTVLQDITGIMIIENAYLALQSLTYAWNAMMLKHAHCVKIKQLSTMVNAMLMDYQVVQYLKIHIHLLVKPVCQDFTLIVMETV